LGDIGQEGEKKFRGCGKAGGFVVERKERNPISGHSSSIGQGRVNGGFRFTRAPTTENKN